MARTIGSLFTEVRVVLQDTDATNYRFSNAELMMGFNSALTEIRAKRPDLFLGMGMRETVPLYDASTDLAVEFPLDLTAYTPVTLYVIGHADLREGTNGDEGRAAAAFSMFRNQLLGTTT